MADNNWNDIFWCSDVPNLPSFFLNFGGYWFEVKSADYSVEVSTDVCALCILAIDGYDEWILGDAFMRGWYNIHDHTNQRMGFVPFPGSTKTMPEERTDEDVRPSDVQEPEPDPTPDSSTSDSFNTLPPEEPEPEHQILGMEASKFYRVATLLTLGTLVTTTLLLVYCFLKCALRQPKNPHRRQSHNRIRQKKRNRVEAFEAGADQEPNGDVVLQLILLLE